MVPWTLAGTGLFWSLKEKRWPYREMRFDKWVGPRPGKSLWSLSSMPFQPGSGESLRRGWKCERGFQICICKRSLQARGLEGDELLSLGPQSGGLGGGEEVKDTRKVNGQHIWWLMVCGDRKRHKILVGLHVQPRSPPNSSQRGLEEPSLAAQLVPLFLQGGYGGRGLGLPLELSLSIIRHKRQRACR